MSTDLRSTIPTGSSPASYADWGRAVSGAFAACGMVRTADTGQIDWATLAFTPPQGTYSGVTAGYEMWRFSDALQSSAPVFLRISYGSSSGQWMNSPAFCVSVTVGTGTDGAGHLTGNVSPGFTPTPAGYGVGAAFPTYASGDGSRIAMALNVGATNLVFSVERSRDASGNATGAYVTFFACSVGWQWNTTGVVTSRVLAVIPPSGQAMMPAESLYSGDNGVARAPALTPSTVASGSIGGTLNLFPHYPYDYAVHNPGMGLVTYFAADTAAGFAIPVTMYGASHQFMPLGPAINSAHCSRTTTPAGLSLAMLWE